MVAERSRRAANIQSGSDSWELAQDVIWHRNLGSGIWSTASIVIFGCLVFAVGAVFLWDMSQADGATATPEMQQIGAMLQQIFQEQQAQRSRIDELGQAVHGTGQAVQNTQTITEQVEQQVVTQVQAGFAQEQQSNHEQLQQVAQANQQMAQAIQQIQDQVQQMQQASAASGATAATSGVTATGAVNDDTCVVDGRSLGKPVTYDPSSAKVSFQDWSDSVITVCDSVMPGSTRSIGRQRAALIKITNPTAHVAIDKLSSEIVGWENKIVDYESRPGADKVSDAMKMAAVVHMCPTKLQEHLQLNAGRFRSYLDLREEVFVYLDEVAPAASTTMDAGSLSKDTFPDEQQYAADDRLACVAANSETVPELYKIHPVVAPEEGILKRTQFSVAAVNKVLMSAAEMANRGHQIVLNPAGEDSWIEDREDGSVMRLYQQHGVYVQKLCVVLPHKVGFSGPASSGRNLVRMMDALNGFIGFPWQLRPVPVPDGGAPRVVLDKAIQIDLPVERPDQGCGIGALCYTEGCDGCMAAKQGLTHRQQNRACRERIAQELVKTAEGRARLERVREKEEKYIVDFHDKETERGKRAGESVSRVFCPLHVYALNLHTLWILRMGAVGGPQCLQVALWLRGFAAWPRLSGFATLWRDNFAGLFPIRWDFSLEDCRARAIELIEFLDPDLVIGSPPCGPYSMLQELNVRRTPPDVRARTLAQADEHLEFCCEQYEARHRRHKFFLHAHPAYARSWGRTAIQRLEQMPGVLRVAGDMCEQGMTLSDEHGVRRAKKTTGFLTNSPYIAEELSKRCSNEKDALQAWRQTVRRAVHGQKPGHGGPSWDRVVRRVRLDVSRGVVLQDLHDVQSADPSLVNFQIPKESCVIESTFYHVVYPSGLIRSILKKGLRKQLTKDIPVSALDFGPVNQEQDLDLSLGADDWCTFTDEVSGKALESSKVASARAEEIDYAERYKVWDVVPISECYQKTGKGPISSRWIDINKGDEQGYEAGLLEGMCGRLTGMQQLVGSWRLQISSPAVRLILACITPAMPLVLLLCCVGIEVGRRGSGVNAALKILTIFFVGGASKCANLVSCQQVDAGGWHLQGDMPFLRYLPDVPCDPNSMVSEEIAPVFWPCAVCYGVLIPCFLLYLYARQHLVLRYSRMPLELTRGSKSEHLAVSHQDHTLQLRLVAGLVAYVSMLQHGSVKVQLRDGKGTVTFLDGPDGEALELDAVASSTATSDLLIPIGKVLAATLVVVATVWMVRPYAQPQVNDLQICCFMGR
eukprot:symbB.v1.2.022644.t1/scaffold2018.1/size92264/4